MRAHHRCLHAFSGFEGVFGHLVCCHNWNPAFCAFAFRVLPFESVSSRPYGSFSCRFCGFQEGAFLWLPRRCVFDGFLQEFEGFKGYVRPLSGRLSLAGWAGILLGLCRFACLPTTGTSMLLAVSKVLFGHLSAATIRHPLGWNLARAFRFGRVPTTGTSMLLAVSKDKN